MDSMDQNPAETLYAHLIPPSGRCPERYTEVCWDTVESSNNGVICGVRVVFNPFGLDDIRLPENDPVFYSAFSTFINKGVTANEHCGREPYGAAGIFGYLLGLGFLSKDE